MKKFLSILLTLCFLMSVSGCSTNEDEGDAVFSGIASVEFSENDEIALYSYKTDAFCPILSDNKANNRMLGIVYDGLISLDDELLPLPELAESWSVLENGNSWVINLREGVKWHDGSAFNASDVVYTVNKIKEHEISIYQYNVSKISKISKVNGNSVKIDLSEPCSTFINLLYFPIIKNNSVGEDENAFQPIGTGAFRFEDRKEGNIYYLVKNDDWWGGKINNDIIEIKMLPDKDTALYAFSSGSIDIAEAEGMDWGKFVDPSSASVVSVETPIYNFIGINHNKSILKMNEVRTAISQVIDRQAIIDEVAMGYAKAVNAPVRTSWYVCKNKELRYVRNTKAAQKTLLDNGWELSKYGYGKKTDEGEQYITFELLINDGNQVRENVAKIIEKNLEEFGIKISIIKLPYDEYKARILNGEYDLFVGSYLISPDLSFDFMLGSGNVFGYSDNEMTKVLNDIKRQTENDMLQEKYSKFINLFEEQNPIIGLYFEDSVMTYSNRIKGDVIPSYFNWYRGIEKLYKGAVK